MHIWCTHLVVLISYTHLVHTNRKQFETVRNGSNCRRRKQSHRSNCRQCQSNEIDFFAEWKIQRTWWIHSIFLRRVLSAIGTTRRNSLSIECFRYGRRIVSAIWSRTSRVRTMRWLGFFQFAASNLMSCADCSRLFLHPQNEMNFSLMKLDWEAQQTSWDRVWSSFFIYFQIPLSRRKCQLF